MMAMPLLPTHGEGFTSLTLLIGALSQNRLYGKKTTGYYFTPADNELFNDPRSSMVEGVIEEHLIRREHWRTTKRPQQESRATSSYGSYPGKRH